MRAGRSSTLPIVVSTEPAEPPKARWRLDIAYDGTNFSGWAAQAGLRTVQGELETWITRVLRLHEEGMRREACALDRMRFNLVRQRLRERYGWS